MKKLIAASITSFLFLFSALPAHAASFLIDPAPALTAPGGTLSLSIPFTPGPDTIYTVQVEILYPTHILDGVTFTLNQNSTRTMRILSADPYTRIDEGTGVMRYTIGFPGGLNEPIILGTAHFTVTGEGTGTISISPSSQALTANDTNVADPFLLSKTIRSDATPGVTGTGTGLTTVLPITSTVAPGTSFTTSGPRSTNAGLSDGTVALVEDTATTSTSTTGVDAADLQASVAEAVDGRSTNTVLLWILIGLVALSIISALFGLFRRT